MHLDFAINQIIFHCQFFILAESTVTAELQFQNCLSYVSVNLILRTSSTIIKMASKPTEGRPRGCVFSISRLPDVKEPLVLMIYLNNI